MMVQTRKMVMEQQVEKSVGSSQPLLPNVIEGIGDSMAQERPSHLVATIIEEALRRERAPLPEEKEVVPMEGSCSYG